MSSNLLVQLGTVGTLILGSAGIWVALLNQRRQLNAQMFIEFSKRFQDLLHLFPTEAWIANLNPSKPLPPRSQELTDCTLYCIQLAADVFHLHQGGYISKGLWTLWEREIRHAITGPVFQREWEDAAADFAHIPDFVQYINTLMLRRSPHQTSGVSVASPLAGVPEIINDRST